MYRRNNGVIMKIAINKSYGGFTLSERAYEFLGLEWDGRGNVYRFNTDRANPKLIECIETLGPLVNGRYADIQIVEIPDGVKWQVDEYDGKEWVAECHRTWGKEED